MTAMSNLSKAIDLLAKLRGGKRRRTNYMKTVGKTREKIADMISKTFLCECCAEEIWIQNPAHAKADLARWGVDVNIKGVSRNVHSWDRMTDIVKAGGLVRVGSPDSDYYEVCARD